MRGRANSWTCREIRLLEKLYPTETWDVIQSQIKRSRKSIGNKASDLGIRRVMFFRTIPPCELCSELRRVRLEMGLSMPKLAELMDCDPGNISQLELRNRAPGTRVLTKWLDALGLRIRLEPVARNLSNPIDRDMSSGYIASPAGSL